MSGFYIGVDGKARKVKGGYIGIDGKARKIKKGYIGVNGVARLCWSGFDPVLANNTWEEIAAACAAGSVPDEWAVGDSKTMNIGGVDYVVDIIGKNHDDYSDGSGKAPLTFQLHDCLNTTYSLQSTNTNGMGWNGCDLRNTALPKVLADMPSEVQSAIRAVYKQTVVGGTYGTDVYTSEDKLFVLSEIEVLGNRNFSKAGEGSRYAYYANGGSKVKKVNGAASDWWLRSPQLHSTSAFCQVTASGGTTANYANALLGVSFAFCF